MIRVIADRAIPYVEALCAHWCDLKTLPAEHITSEAIKGAEALLVRTVTEVNTELLANTGVQFVGSATAGSDHIDLQGMHKAGVSVACAPGCNANAVVDYVLSAIFQHTDAAALLGQTAGIFGYGNIGRRLVAVLDQLGIRSRIYDPLLALDKMVLPARADVVHSAAEILAADIISLHVPLTHSVAHPTFHLLGEQEFKQLQNNALVINTSRGAVVDNRALLGFLQLGGTARLVLDVWEGEPSPIPELVARVSLASPHIAGYSIAAKLRATHTVVASMRAFFAASNEKLGQHNLPEPPTLRESVHTLASNPEIVQMSRDVQALCPLNDLSAEFKQRLTSGANSRAARFTQLRADYPLRDEHNYTALLPSRILHHNVLSDGN